MGIDNSTILPGAKCVGTFVAAGMAIRAYKLGKAVKKALKTKKTKEGGGSGGGATTAWSIVSGLLLGDCYSLYWAIQDLIDCLQQDVVAYVPRDWIKRSTSLAV